MSFIYPTKVVDGVLTPADIHKLLSTPRLVARRVADKSKMRFVSDFLLPGDFDATGGGVFYENADESAFSGTDPSSIQPGGSYPRQVLDDGTASAAATVKWGLESGITDEKIARQGRSYLDRSIGRLVNTVVRKVDLVSMAAISAKVTSTHASGDTWTTAGKVAEALMALRGQRADEGTGLDLDTVLLTSAQWAKLIGILVDDKALPREQGNIVVTGMQPINALGFTWVTSPHFTGADPLLLDPANLGGMGREDLQSPGYVKAGTLGVEALTQRSTSSDGYDLRARRVTVPVILDPRAGARITGAGL